MLRFLSAGSIDRYRRTDRIFGLGSTRRRARHPRLESLETRITPSTMTWTGATSGNWMTASNWSSNTAPQPGDDLVFPPSASDFNVLNNFPANTQFNSITIQSPNYSLTGNPIDLVTGLNAVYGSGTSNDSINTDLESGVVSVSSGGTLNLEGVISGTAGLNLSGTGTLNLMGLNTYTGPTVVGNSTLVVNSSLGPVNNSGGDLGGSGTVVNVTSVGGTIDPANAGGPVVLTTGSLSLDANSTFTTELDGTSPGNGISGYGQVVATGPVSLNGATLNVTFGSNYIPKVGAQYTIIKNTSGSISGTFAGLPEGSIDDISGYEFEVSYQGGSGQDVVLTALPYATTTSITASTTASTYGQPVSFTAIVSGSQNNAPGQIAFYDGNPSNSPTRLGVVNVGPGEQAKFTTSALSVSGSPQEIYAMYLPSSSSEYGSSVTTVPAFVTINPAVVTPYLTGTITKTYDGTTSATSSSGSFQLAGVIGDDAVGVVPGASYYSTQNVGTGETVTVNGLSLTGANASDYVLANDTVSGAVGVINPATLTVTGITASDKVYDGTTTATIDTSGATFTGIIGSDNVSLVTTGAAGIFETKNVGIGMRVSVNGLSLSGADAGNYVISPLTEATASITPAPLTITANPGTMTYGGTLPTLTDSVNGLVGSDTVGTALSGSLETTASSRMSVGDYPITQGTIAAVDGDYAITFVGANLSITPAPLTITANDATKFFGAPISTSSTGLTQPTLTASYSGFVNGDTVSSLTTPAVLMTTATASSPVGVYPITVGGAGSSNYTITDVPGTLTISKASSSIAVSTTLNGVVSGQIETFNATVLPLTPSSGNPGMPSGDVTFLLDGTPIAMVPVDSATGHASFSISSIAPGSHTVTATYSGDSNFQTSQSTPSSLLVSSASTQSILTDQDVLNKRGKVVSVILTSQVVALSPGNGVPTGSVTFYRDGHTLGREALVNGTARISIKANQALNKSFFFEYSGDSDFNPGGSQGVVPTHKSLKGKAQVRTAFFKRG